MLFDLELRRTHTYPPYSWLNMNKFVLCPIFIFIFIHSLFRSLCRSPIALYLRSIQLNLAELNKIKCRNVSHLFSTSLSLSPSLSRSRSFIPFFFANLHICLCYFPSSKRLVLSPFVSCAFFVFSANVVQFASFFLLCCHFSIHFSYIYQMVAMLQNNGAEWGYTNECKFV